MSYKFRNIFGLTALTLILGLSEVNMVHAQGVVMLSENATDEDPALKDIPDEVSLFDDDNDRSVPLEKETPAKHVVSTRSKPADTPLKVKVNLPAPEEDNLSLVKPSLGTNNSGGILGTKDFAALDDNVFSTMSNLEKQTAVLDLELRREKVKNEIEAIKNQRKLAVEQEQEKQETKRREKIEWEKAQEAKVVTEQQKLREMDIAFEKVRQEKLLNSYKNKMLEENQKWVASNAHVYEQIENLRQENQRILQDSKNKLSSLKTAIIQAGSKAAEVKAAYQRNVADLQTQITVLKARIEAQEKELMAKQNPFAEGEDGENGVNAGVGGTAQTTQELRLADMYAVMEIRGQNGELIAKLINQDGNPFYVRKGTSLQSGHIVDEITSTYVRADKNGIKDYLYFAAGGVLPLEVTPSNIAIKEGAAAQQEEKAQEHHFISSDTIPGMGKDMIAR